MSLASMLRTSGTLKRRTSTVKDSSGGIPPATAAAVSGATSIACDIQPASSNTITKYMQKQLDCSHSIYFNQDVAALEGDVFVSAAGLTYKVLGRRLGAPGYTQWPCILDVAQDVTS